MQMKGTRRGLFHSSPLPSPSSASSSSSSSPLPSPNHSHTMLMEHDCIASAEQIIARWDPDGSPFAKITSLFHESRGEAHRFLAAASNLHRAMHSISASYPSAASASTSHSSLVRAQRLMEVAMKRLQKEFYQILAANRDRLDNESARSSLSTSTSFSDLDDAVDDYDAAVGSPTDRNSSEDDEIRAAEESIRAVERPNAAVMADLRAIAECMISTGYAKECVGVYKGIRRSIVEEGLYRLGFEKLSTNSQLQKLDWDSAERRIRNWLSASRVAFQTLFSGERALCDFVFGSSESIKESCFAEIARDAAVNFLAFPEIMTTKGKRTPGKIFLFLDMYNSIAELWPEIESLFSYESTTAVHSQVLSTLLRLGEAVRSMLADFETSIQKDTSKATVTAGGLHPLTHYAMSYMTSLADYSGAIVDIFADYPLASPRTPPPEPFLAFLNSASVPPSPCSTIDEEEAEVPAPVSARLAWLMVVLLCKLDGKAELYKDATLSYLFLANNLQRIVTSVRGTRLSRLIGNDWAPKHEQKARSFLTSYERLSWARVLDSIPENPTALMEEGGVAAARERMKEFNNAFEDAYRKESGRVVVDGKMRVELKLSVTRAVIVRYMAFYERCRAALRTDRDAVGVVRFAPEDVGNYLSALYFESSGSPASGSSSPSSSSAGSSHSGSVGSSPKGNRWRSALVRLRRRK